MFKKILIANRGEIAGRIIRAAKELKIQSVCIYHEVDKEARFVQTADYSYKITGETPRSAYLDIQQIIDIAKKSGAEAIHPGYGFLSERAEFSQAVQDAGLTFIGPNPHSIKVMGSKTQARELMASAGVPIVPGTKEKITDKQRLYEIAEQIGYPILLKASAGGGGKGMRKCYSAEELEANFESAQREALKSFGDDSIYIEKFIENPKHIEIQVLADKFGNYVYLGERDCSIQRRHQKVIEEAPSTVLDEELREKMGTVAVNAAKACDYVNAGTIEFLFDKNKNFYFLEMNTRLQVEHPVTEMVTNIDIVKEQIKIAAGYPLSFKQSDVKINGHAIECRINAEDPFNNFMPSAGKIKYMREPAGFGIRVDSGVEIGSEVTIHFDNMIAKLIAWGRDREEAIFRMERALKSYRIKGIQTIIPFELLVMQHPEFRYGYFDTGFLENTFDFNMLTNMKKDYEEVIAAIATYGYNYIKSNSTGFLPKENKSSNWKMRRIKYFKYD